jgi:hypothetical protein
MTEEQLLELGFEKEFSIEEVDGQPEYYYFIKEITRGLTFITNASDEIVDGEWYVEFFDTEIPVRYCEFDRVKSLIELLETGKVKETL